MINAKIGTGSSFQLQNKYLVEIGIVLCTEKVKSLPFTWIGSNQEVIKNMIVPEKKLAYNVLQNCANYNLRLSE